MNSWDVGASGIPSGWTDSVYSGGVTVTVDTGASDIAVSISVSNSGAATETYDGSSPIDIGTNANQIVFAAQEGFASYVWKIDNKTVDSSALTTSWKLSLDNISLRTVWPVGVYDIELEAFDAAGNAYSFSAQIKITE